MNILYVEVYKIQHAQWHVDVMICMVCQVQFMQNNMERTYLM